MPLRKQNTSPSSRPPSETGESCDDMDFPQLPGFQSLNYFFCESRPLKDGKFSLECKAVDKKHLPSSSANSCSQPRSVNGSNGMYGKSGKKLKEGKFSYECECEDTTNLPSSSAKFKTEPRSQLRSVNESNGKSGKQITNHGIMVNPNPCKRLSFEQGHETEACRARDRFCCMPRPRSPCCEMSTFCLSCCQPKPTRYFQIAPNDPCVLANPCKCINPCKCPKLCKVDTCCEVCPCNCCENDVCCDPCLRNCCTRRSRCKKCVPNCFCCTGKADVFANDDRVVTCCCPPCTKTCTTTCICKCCTGHFFDVAGIRCSCNGSHPICCKNEESCCPCEERVCE